MKKTDCIIKIYYQFSVMIFNSFFMKKTIPIHDIKIPTQIYDAIHSNFQNQDNKKEIQKVCFDIAIAVFEFENDTLQIIDIDELYRKVFLPTIEDNLNIKAINKMIAICEEEK